MNRNTMLDILADAFVSPDSEDARIFCAVMVNRNYTISRIGGCISIIRNIESHTIWQADQPISEFCNNVSLATWNALEEAFEDSRKRVIIGASVRVPFPDRRAA